MSIAARTAIQASTAGTSKAFSLPASTAAGDFLAFCLCLGASNQTFSQSAGTPGWTLLGGNDTGANSCVFGYKIAGVGEVAPTIAWQTSASYNSGIEAWTPTGAPISVDNVSAIVQTHITNAATPAALTPEYSGEASLLLTASIANTSNAAASHTYTPPAGYTNRLDNESTSNPFRQIAIDDLLSAAGAKVAPGADSVVDAGANTFNINVLHILINQTGGPWNMPPQSG